MERAFSPHWLAHYIPAWGGAPGWDNNAPLALGWFFDWRIPVDQASLTL